MSIYGVFLSREDYLHILYLLECINLFLFHCLASVVGSHKFGVSNSLNSTIDADGISTFQNKGKEAKDSTYIKVPMKNLQFHTFYCLMLSF